MKKIIILLGIPGSGKGTQAAVIAEKFGHRHVSSGALLRALATDPVADPDDKAKAAAMQAGNLVADDLIYKLVFGEIQRELASARGVILDGAIRNLDQAKKYQEFFIVNNFADEVRVIHLDVPEDESVARLGKRQRADDQPEIIKKRLADQGSEALQPLVDFYESLGVLTRVNARQDIEHVSQDISKILEKA